MTLTSKQRAAARSMALAWEYGREAVDLAIAAKTTTPQATFVAMVKEANRIIREGDERGPYYGYMPGKISSTNTLLQTIRRVERHEVTRRHNETHGKQQNPDKNPVA